MLKHLPALLAADAAPPALAAIRAFALFRCGQTRRCGSLLLAKGIVREVGR